MAALPIAASHSPWSNPSEWPAADSGLDDWVREAAQAAADGNGIVLQQLVINRPDPPRAGQASPPPFAVLTIGARGTYAALKAWQSVMQALIPSLGVESLRWSAPGNDGSGLLQAEWVWRLWLRPTDAVAPPERPAYSLMRPDLGAALKDPFGFATPLVPVAPQRVARAAPVAEPFPVSAPVQVIEPPPQWTTIGRLRAPDGSQRVTGHWGTETDTLSVGEGDLAPSGYKVTRITEQVMELEHPQTQQRLSFRLPPPPPFESR